MAALAALPIGSRMSWRTDVRLPGFRRLALFETRYFIYYRVDEVRGQVEVLRVWHMSRHRPPGLR